MQALIAYFVRHKTAPNIAMILGVASRWVCIA